MKKREKFVKIFELSVSKILFDFVNNEVLRGTNISSKRFWNGFNKTVHQLVPINKKLIQTRHKMQRSIDNYHLNRKGQKFKKNDYKKFLKKIGYLKSTGPNFKIQTKNVDNEISSICGPQLVCPVSNARFLLNAANARWVSLYDSLYGADIIPETRGALKGNTYNPIRGKEVILYSRNLLDKIIPLKNKSWMDLKEIPKILNNKLKLDLLNQNQFIGYSKKSNKISSILFKNNNLHIDILFDQTGKMEINNPEGNQDPLKIHDIFLESAITTICDHEDSVAAVDAEDKVHGYKNWLLLMVYCSFLFSYVLCQDYIFYTNHLLKLFLLNNPHNRLFFQEKFYLYCYSQQAELKLKEQKIVFSSVFSFFDLFKRIKILVWEGIS